MYLNGEYKANEKKNLLIKVFHRSVIENLKEKVNFFFHLVKRK